MGAHVRYTGVLFLMLKVKIAVSKEWFYVRRRGIFQRG
jgi:hypothetical protein